MAFDNVALNIDTVTLAVFVVLFAIFTFLGFYGYKWRQGDLRLLHEWALAGRRLGWFLAWFLLGADLLTAYTFVALPSSVLVSGSLYFFAVPFVVVGYGIALVTMPKLWEYAKEHNLVTASDFVKFRFGSKSLSIAVALVGTVAELPYIALQIVGMQAVLTMLLIGLTHTVDPLIEEIALVVAFIILAAFTWTSGLRGATLTGVLKDVLIWTTVLVTLAAVFVTSGGFQSAFETAGLSHLTNVSSNVRSVLKGTTIPYGYLPITPSLAAAYITLALGSAFAYFLYPHAVNAALSASSTRNLKLSTALMPLYAVVLALLALFGVLIYNYPSALAVVEEAKAGTLTVPALVSVTTPDWFVGLAFAAIFVGGLVPASVMAIAVGNLVARNIVGEVANLSPQTELKIAKWVSFFIKFVALGFVFVVPTTYALALQLFGTILMIQTLPAVFLGLFTRKLHPGSTLAGLAIGVGLGVYLTLYVNNFGQITKSLFQLGPVSLYIGILALAVNLAVVLVGTALAYARGWRPSKVAT